MQLTRLSGILLLVLALSIPVADRAYGSNDMMLLGLELGFGTGGIALGASLSWQHGDDLWTLRWMCNYSLARMFHAPQETTWETGLLYGRIRTGSAGFLSASAGIALVGGTRQGALVRSKPFDNLHKPVRFLTLGLSGQLQAVWVPFGRFFGIGARAAGDLNLREPFANAAAAVYFGEMD